MAKKSKKFRIATEGATADGRTIERAWLTQMAESYDPATYTATINLEHYRGIIPDSPFRNYGFVESLSTATNDQGKLQLFAVITPTEDLVAMTKKGQKVFTSMEVNTKFADSGKAYLIGLAVTDNPASLGTEMLEFAAKNPDASPFKARKQNPENLFTAAEEAELEFVDESTEAPGVLARIKKMFAAKHATDDARFNDLAAAVEEVAEHGEAQSQSTARQFQTVDGQIKANATQLGEYGARLDALEKLFNSTEKPGNPRPAADGSHATQTQF
ncbi:GPO family capsid scaffolding protein [Dyella sp. ASV21]|uniref:GPO family capsid scaffolding protein n=1 Tax=Dyella sp. ASV21 TaxID=2795114 RepID=UPI0018EB127A|nr:GPO family capsid scaffolding protein [Dyella sp. ASV21]